jgi:hypothetical protein
MTAADFIQASWRANLPELLRHMVAINIRLFATGQNPRLSTNRTWAITQFISSRSLRTQVLLIKPSRGP